MGRQQAGFATRFGRRQHQHPELGAGGQRGDRRRLSVRGDHSLQLAPQLVHRVQLGRLRRQPDEADIEALGQCLRLMIGVARRPIGEQPEGAPTAVPLAQLEEKRARVGSCRSGPRDDDAMRGGQADCPEQHDLRVPPRYQHFRGRADRRPRGTQRWEQSQQRPIREEDDVARADVCSQATAESPFFCGRWVARCA